MWIIFGFAIVSFCYIVGKWIGMNFGAMIGVGDVGGVAFAMLGVVVISNTKLWSGRVDERVKNGVMIASAIYLPVIVAMVYKTNVWGAVQAGPIAIIAGFMAILTGLLLVRPLARIGPVVKIPEAKKEKEGKEGGS